MRKVAKILVRNEQINGEKNKLLVEHLLTADIDRQVSHDVQIVELLTLF